MRADRLIAIMLRLQAQGKMTSYELADELEVSRRTILRDIEALSSAGIPIYAEAGHHGGVALDANYRIKLTGLKESEVRALILSGHQKVLEDIGLGQAAENTTLKLFAALPSLHQEAARQMQQRIYIDPVWWWHGQQDLDFIDKLYEAVTDDKCIQVIYEKRHGEISEYSLEPYALVAKSSMWYLVAMRDGELRSYRVSRFIEVKLLDKNFMRPDDFNLKQYWDSTSQAFAEGMLQYTCQLRVRKSRLNFVRWYTAGRWEMLEESEGDFLANFEFEAIEPAKMLIFGLGADVQIIQPQSLIDAMREALDSFRL